MQMNQINLDINKSGQIINEPVVLRVGDKDQTITVNLLKDGQPYTSFTTATFFANKPSGAIVANDPANISGGTITYTVPQALVNEFGKITNAYFLIDGKVSTENFVIAVLQGVRVSDDLGDLIPGMGNLNVIYDKWKAKLDSIDRELQGIDAPKEVKNVIDNELKNYTDQVNELQKRITTLKAQLDALEVPVNAVGTNLLLGTGNNLSITGTNAPKTTSYNYPLNGYTVSSLALAFGTQFVISYDWSVSGSSPSGAFSVQWNNTPWGTGMSWTTVSSSNTSGRISDIINVNTNSKNVANMVGFILTNFVGTLTISNVKLEKGSLATDWCPNPSEILTQSDYAKIKAAILSLGGHL